MSQYFDTLQRKTEIWRQNFFKPILRHCFFHPHDITTFRLLLALGFPLFILSSPLLAWVLITISIALDAFDGAVARFKKIDSDRGKFIDVLVDQITFILLCLGLIRLLPNFSLVFASLGFSIPLTYLITMTHKNEKQPSDWIIKPQARLTIYKFVFLLIIIGFLNHWISSQTTYLLLWVEIIIACFHFSWHYYGFVHEDKK